MTRDPRSLSRERAGKSGHLLLLRVNTTCLTTQGVSTGDLDTNTMDCTVFPETSTSIFGTLLS